VERFACETTIISGEGALAALAEQPGKRLLVVTDGLEIPGSIMERIRGMIKPEDAACFGTVTPEPTMGQAVEGAKKIKALCPELVVALGGSHVMDCAKAMVCFSGKTCHLVMVPTAAGSGAEVTGRVTLSHDRRRHIFRNPSMHPNVAILDSSLLADSPSGKIAEGGFEILANSLESYVGKSTGMLTGLHAREAFAAGWGALPAAFAGKLAARGRLQGASAMAGVAYDRTGLGLCYAMAESLGSVFHLPQGSLAGILLPAVIGCNAHAAGRKLAELARAAGMGGSSEAVGVRNLKTALIRLRRELGMPATLAQAGVNPRWIWSNVQRIVDLTLENPECRNNPVTVDDFLVRRILEETAGHY